MLILSEESIESAVTCMSCMSILNNPVTMTRCGHNVCLACVTAKIKIIKNEITEIDKNNDKECEDHCIITCPECGLEHSNQDNDKTTLIGHDMSNKNNAYVENRALDIMASKQAYRKDTLLSLQKLCSVSC